MDRDRSLAGHVLFRANQGVLLQHQLRVGNTYVIIEIYYLE